MDPWLRWSAERGFTHTDLYIQWIPEGLESGKGERDGAKLTPNSFFDSISPHKASGRAALENADTVNMMALPAKTFSTT